MHGLTQNYYSCGWVVGWSGGWVVGWLDKMKIRLISAEFSLAGAQLSLAKANARMELLRRVADFDTPVEDMKTIYILFIRSILEQSATVWHSSLSIENAEDLERVQKSATRIMLKDSNLKYDTRLEKLGLETLTSRREILCLNFALKCTKNDELKQVPQE